ncbi:hypothetical protein [Bacillus sp. FJAT-44742]|nr:hypothetical protein [Bacillus sp. FJAT-44742]
MDVTKQKAAMAFFVLFIQLWQYSYSTAGPLKVKRMPAACEDK